MRFVAFYTDFGTADHYAGLVKAAFYGISESLRVVDMSHQIPQGDIQTAGFLLARGLESLPSGTLHVCCIAPQPGPYAHVFFEHKRHFFLGTDSGQFRLALGEEAKEAWDVSHLPGGEGTFPSLVLFPKLAKDVLEGKSPESWKVPKIQLVDKVPRKPHKTEEAVVGNIVYIDETGNTLTNITRRHLEVAFPGIKDFVVETRGQRYRIQKISERYADVQGGEVVAVFNASGFLELAIYLGNLAELMGLEVNSNVAVKPLPIAPSNAPADWDFGQGNLG